MTPEPKNRITIYVGPPTRRVLDDAGGENASGAINGACAAYLRVVEDHKPTLSSQEWCAVFDAMNGTIIDDVFQRHGGKMLALEISDACRLNALDEKWDVNGPLLTAKLHDLTTAEATSVLHHISAFWANHELPTDEILKKLGIE